MSIAGSGLVSGNGLLHSPGICFWGAQEMPLKCEYHIL